MKMDVEQVKQILLQHIRAHMKVPRLVLLERHNPKKVNDYLESAANKTAKLIERWQLDRRQALLLCQKVVECGICILEEKQIPLSFSSLVYQIAEPRAALEDQFPCYTVEIFKRFVLITDAERAEREAKVLEQNRQRWDAMAERDKQEAAEMEAFRAKLAALPYREEEEPKPKLNRWGVPMPDEWYE
jgi:hypothetical protein